MRCNHFESRRSYRKIIQISNSIHKILFSIHLEPCVTLARYVQESPHCRIADFYPDADAGILGFLALSRVEQ